MIWVTVMDVNSMVIMEAHDSKAFIKSNKSNNSILFLIMVNFPILFFEFDFSMIYFPSSYIQWVHRLLYRCSRRLCSMCRIYHEAHELC